MGLSPDVEEMGRKDEAITVDTNWSVQELTQLVALEILTPEEAREHLGLSAPRGEAVEASTEAELERRHAQYRRK
jgi:hypothetical protein